MTRTTISRTIDAPVALVFRTVADIANFARAVPHITKVELLSEQQVGQGTRFRETRVMKGREASTELEVTEYVEDEHVRLVSDAGGTRWDTVFTVEPKGDLTKLTMVMDAKAHRLLARLINPLIKGMVARAIEQDMDAIKTYCERQGRAEVPTS
ncbi:MAG: SRPBCC family protein [Nannocystaceae bacterium]